MTVKTLQLLDNLHYRHDHGRLVPKEQLETYLNAGVFLPYLDNNDILHASLNNFQCGIQNDSRPSLLKNKFNRLELAQVCASKMVVTDVLLF